MPQTSSLMRPLPVLLEGVQQDAATAQATTGTGQIFELPMDWNGLPTSVRVEVSGTFTGLSLDIEGSDDPAFGTPQKLQVGISVAGSVWIVDKPIRFIRTNVTAIASNSVTVRFTNAGKG